MNLFSRKEKLCQSYCKCGSNCCYLFRLTVFFPSKRKGKAQGTLLASQGNLYPVLDVFGDNPKESLHYSQCFQTWWSQRKSRIRGWVHELLPWKVLSTHTAFRGVFRDAHSFWFGPAILWTHTPLYLIARTAKALTLVLYDCGLWKIFMIQIIVIESSKSVSKNSPQNLQKCLFKWTKDCTVFNTFMETTGYR